VAATHNNIAFVYKHQGQYELALQHSEKCLAIEIKSLGENHASVATTKYNLISQNVFIN